MRAPRRELTVKVIEKLKAPTGPDPIEHYDATVPGFGVRVTSAGTKSWVLVYMSPTTRRRRRFTIGRVDLATPNEVTSFNLQQARLKASTLRGEIAAGADPAEAVKAQAQAEIAAKEDRDALEERKFKKVFDLFDALKLQTERRGWEVKQIIKRELLPHWKDKLVTDITATDVEKRVMALVTAGSPTAAHRLFEVTRRFFNWAAARPSLGFGDRRLPTERMQPKALIGKKGKRRRILSNDEIVALWRASDRIGYPYGAYVKLLFLTGLRRVEALEGHRSEFKPALIDDLTLPTWEISAERMKADRPHVVPLTEDALAVIESIPRWNAGDYLFTADGGMTPITSLSKPKRQLDALMLEELRKIAAGREDRSLAAYVDKIADLLRRQDAAEGAERRTITRELRAIWWTYHDIRRTLRTHLSALPIQEIVRELLIAHKGDSLHQVYDQFSYIKEKHEGLALWAARLRAIVTPPPANVVPLRRALAP